MGLGQVITLNHVPLTVKSCFINSGTRSLASKIVVSTHYHNAATMITCLTSKVIINIHWTKRKPILTMFDVGRNTFLINNDCQVLNVVPNERYLTETFYLCLTYHSSLSKMNVELAPYFLYDKNDKCKNFNSMKQYYNDHMELLCKRYLSL